MCIKDIGFIVYMDCGHQTGPVFGPIIIACRDVLERGQQHDILFEKGNSSKGNALYTG
jgi:hypothetical protein